MYNHEDLDTATDIEVLCRVVDRWVGQGGKASVANTADADNIGVHTGQASGKDCGEVARTFLVKVKAHRGEPLNEGEDNLA